MRFSTFLSFLCAAAIPSGSVAVQAPRQCGSPAALFGRRKIWSTTTQVRGGAVAEPGTAQDTDDLILKAAVEDKLVVIDFSATWCGPCKMIAPLFKELSEGYDNVVFVKVDVDDNPETAAKYNVSAMPTFVFLKKGEVVDRLMGASPARLEELIEEHM